MKIHYLFFDQKKEVWICSCCGAEYHRPKSHKPSPDYCMKCHAKWCKKEKTK